MPQRRPSCAHGGTLTTAEERYLALQSKAGSLGKDKIALGPIRKELQSVNQSLGEEYLAHLREAQSQNLRLRVQEMQAEFDNHTWPAVLSRQEAADILSHSDGAAQTRLLLLAAEPNVSELCPAIFQKELSKEVRGKLKQFVARLFPTNSPVAVEFHGKFFRSEVFDTEIRQIEHILTPLPVATIFTDVTRKEIMFHVRLRSAKDAPVFVMTTSFPWREEQRRLCTTGVDEEESLDAAMEAIVSIHQLLAGLLGDLHFLSVNPLHQPRLFDLKSAQFPTGWLEALSGDLRKVQAKVLKDYEEALRQAEAQQQVLKEQDAKFARMGWGKAIGQFRLHLKDHSSLALDTKTNVVWCRVNMENFKVDWEEANEIIRVMNKERFEGFNDWRFPNRAEWNSFSITSAKAYDQVFFRERGSFWFFDKEDKIKGLVGVGDMQLEEKPDPRMAEILYIHDMSELEFEDGLRHGKYFIRIVRGDYYKSS